MMIESADDLLYGQTGPRKIAEQYQMELEEGVIGYYDNQHKIFRIVIADGTRYRLSYTVKSPKSTPGQTEEEKADARARVQKTIDGPATIHTDRWGRPHREPEASGEIMPAIEKPEVSQWYQNGLLHRQGAPAVTKPDGFQAWHLNGVYHREDGPAISWPTGEESWYLHGVEFKSEEEMLAALEQLNA